MQNIPGKKNTGAKHNPQIIPASKENSLFDNIIKEFVDLFIWACKIAFIAVLKIKKRGSKWKKFKLNY